MSARRPALPSGMAPPALAELADGRTLALRPLAEKISDAHLARHPEDVDRYGATLAHAWCTHDNQHLLAWAIGDVDLQEQLGWLARVLSARGYPVSNLIDDVAIGANVVAEEVPTAAGRAVAGRMRTAARALSAQTT